MKQKCGKRRESTKNRSFSSRENGMGRKKQACSHRIIQKKKIFVSAAKIYKMCLKRIHCDDVWNQLLCSG